MRSKSKIFRLTELQLEQLEKHLEKEGTTFTDFIHSLIQREVMQDTITVKQPTEEQKKPRFKVKTVIEVVKRYQKTDPALLLELAKIGNNLNQIARALNIIKNADHQEQRKLLLHPQAPAPEHDPDADQVVHREANKKRNWDRGEIMQPKPFLEQQQRAVIRRKSAKRGNCIPERLQRQPCIILWACSCLFQMFHTQQYNTEGGPLNTPEFEP